MAAHGNPTTGLVASKSTRGGHSARGTTALIVLWALGVASGAALLWRYQLGSDDSPPSAPTMWPTNSGLARSPGFTLVMAVHPRCPCTRATMGELARLMTRLQGRLVTHVLFVRPRGAPAGFEHTDLWTAATRIEGANPTVDDEGRTSVLFGARTSGSVALYDPDGDLVFRGGITSSRGHEGANVGARRVIDLVEREATDRNESRVFGCALEDGEAL